MRLYRKGQLEIFMVLPKSVLYCTYLIVCNNILSSQQGAEWPGSPHCPCGHHQARANIIRHSRGLACSQSTGQIIRDF